MFITSSRTSYVGSLFDHNLPVTAHINLDCDVAVPCSRFLQILAGAGMLFIPCMPATTPRAATEYGAEQDRSRPSSAYAPSVNFDIERARRNYLALARGSKSPSQLSPAEAKEVRELLERLEQNRAGGKSAYQRCRDQQLGRNSVPTELELRLIELKCSMR